MGGGESSQRPAASAKARLEGRGECVKAQLPFFSFSPEAPKRAESGAGMGVIRPGERGCRG